MTREKAKELLPIIKAYAEGKTIQYLIKDEWFDASAPNFNFSANDYRIKPESKYRPFKNQEECWKEMLKHQPFGWVKNEYKYIQIVCVHKNEIEFIPDEDDDGTLFTSTMDFINMYKQWGYTFVDGTPFGIKED